MDGWKPSVPSGQAFEIGTAEYTKTEKKGIRELGKVGFVLVAGGLGERLGYSGAKVCSVLVRRGLIVKTIVIVNLNFETGSKDRPSYRIYHRYLLHPILLRVHQGRRTKNGQEGHPTSSLHYGFQ